MTSFKQFLSETSDLDSQLKKLGLSRSKYGVGKDIGSLYIHKDYMNMLPENFQEVIKNASKHLPKDFDYTAIKYNRDNSVSFIESPDFDKSDEPIVGKSIKVTPEGKVSETPIKDDPQIWHHKWQWVTDDYPRFGKEGEQSVQGVQKSKERSLKWKSALGTNKDISSRIGTSSYWKNWTAEHGL